jgi:hypothetical protein
MPQLVPEALHPIGAVLVAAVCAAVVGTVFWQARIEDRKVGQGIALGGISHELHGIHGSTIAAALFRDAHRCALRHPARWQAVIGEGALLSPVLGFHSPLPIDWFWRDDYRGHESWLLEKTAEAGRRGDYLVMFQTAPQGLEQNAVRGKIGAFFSDPTMADAVSARLPGRRLFCGSLVGVYQPRA